ncbi:SRPBCC domain-containing protein [Vitiosangium sp. GDMCC 1.1324]|uniref:SRPBCC domain-containing protein n=1 Tax=Vitiosangium sp. (strain GDMCC 1.1324) TaxID=2138576 RepID=UPI00130D8074|nr:SRPBCC domain-containing protein [Vitiosangium sp. GDMCC 1.1324]
MSKNSPETVVKEPELSGGRAGVTRNSINIDLRPGGTWHYVWRGPDGAEMEMNGVYQERVPPERLVQTESWGSDWSETLDTLVLTEQDGKTTMMCTVLYASNHARDRALATGMKEGLSASYDLLDLYLRTLASRSAEAGFADTP